MQSLSKRLPPLDTLIAFEAAARLGSFTLAAGELNLTQAAISQRIRNLEEALGARLFDRAHRSVLLNEAGREYQHTVSMALGHLASASNNLGYSLDVERLTIAVDQSVGHLWLSGRLQEFCDDHSDLTVRLIVSDDLEKCLISEVDVAIVFGGDGVSGFQCNRLFPEEVFPVCSPAYLDKLGQVNSLEDLLKADLIELEDERWDWMNWDIWMTRVLGESLPTSRMLQIGSYPLVVDAACQGCGVALGWSGLVDNLLEEGLLVRLIERSVATENGYNIFRNLHSSFPRQQDAFVSWVHSQNFSTA